MLTYAEVHFRSWFIPSLVYMKQPEILFDAPNRIAPGCPIPVFLIIKDSNRFPIQLEAVIIRIIYDDGRERIARFPYDNLEVNSDIWWDSINIIPEKTGTVTIDAYAFVTIRGKHVAVHVDNYSGTSHRPLKVFAASSPFPGSEGWYHGDIHCHSYYTSDQVEFGAPMEVLAFASYCMGLHWISATDHSYDLDDKADCTTRDPLLLKWRMMRKKAELLNETLTVIPGAEVTCRTQNGRNCHLLTLNSSTFIHGSGDGGERGLDTQTEKSVGEAVSMCVEWGGVSCAAHPLERIPFLEKLFLGRGQWTHTDLESPGITALQIYNGVRDRGFKKGMRAWIQLLLNRRKIYAFGGNDSHGDMNRRRQTWLPFLGISENNEHIFGNVRTILRAKSKMLQDIVEALKNGRAVVTDGPFIDFRIISQERTYYPGDEVNNGKNTIQAEFNSSSEFGVLKKARIIAGISGETSERILESSNLSASEYTHRFSDFIELKNMMYIRADCETDSGKICFTNPIWISEK